MSQNIDKFAREVRVTGAEREKIKRHAKTRKMTRNAHIRKRLLSPNYGSRLSKQNRKLSDSFAILELFAKAYPDIIAGIDESPEIEARAVWSVESLVAIEKQLEGLLDDYYRQN